MITIQQALESTLEFDSALEHAEIVNFCYSNLQCEKEG